MKKKMIGSQFPSNSESSTPSCDNLSLNSIHSVLWIFGCLSKGNSAWLCLYWHESYTPGDITHLLNVSPWLSETAVSVCKSYKGDSWEDKGLVDCLTLRRTAIDNFADHFKHSLIFLPVSLDWPCCKSNVVSCGVIFSTEYDVHLC